MKAIVEIELEDCEEPFDKSEVEMAILKSLDSMWFIGGMDDDDEEPDLSSGLIVTSTSATCKVTGSRAKRRKS